MRGTEYHVAQRHIAEERTPRSHCWVSFVARAGRSSLLVERKRNVMAHAQKPDLVFQRNGRVHLYRLGCQFSRLLAAELCASAVVMLDRPCPIQCKTAGYPLHSPFSPSLLHRCVSVCHHIQFPLYCGIKRDYCQGCTNVGCQIVRVP